MINSGDTLATGVKPLIAYWIWLPGNFEIWLCRTLHFCRRDLDGRTYPPFWPLERPRSTLYVGRGCSLDRRPPGKDMVGR